MKLLSLILESNDDIEKFLLSNPSHVQTAFFNIDIGYYRTKQYYIPDEDFNFLCYLSFTYLESDDMATKSYEDDDDSGFAFRFLGDNIETLSEEITKLLKLINRSQTVFDVRSVIIDQTPFMSNNSFSNFTLDF